MRRVLFGALLFLAACGGDLRNQRPGAVDPAALKAERARFLLTAAAQQAIADIARTANQDALDTCLGRGRRRRHGSQRGPCVEAERRWAEGLPDPVPFRVGPG